MNLPENRFKRALREGRQQIGLWCSLPGSYAAECVAGSGYDWLLFDTEHSPGDPLTVLAQLQAVAPYDVAPVVRPASNDTVLIKRFLDLGAQTLLIPYVQDAHEAQAAVAATRYPPEGVRGVSGLTRATRFGRVAAYAKRASEEICVLVQVETREALDRLEEIAAVEGVDGIFVGPADLAASLGHVGEPGHPEVVSAVEDAVRRIRASGKPAGILTPDPDFARRCIALGTTFTAVAIDVGVLARGTEAVMRQFTAG
ncbi:4-hydroxy-2-oxoheptanedioate aldolase [Methylobacterium nodulans]|uniref:2,4-dihydroxyhept-2-ene-1,7-dioic acid aldolase n=1 Tax=Methylobacterium nodulans (strain LMG 21967 / CNCM I-2342 / ORS 2060) TaxID=460265 RepID=B8IWC0_METNO|nr:4-hydroxy-2-oxoheptanedioate aldolase [Methylobacterium nodulans]ACL62710.1 2,4-dihydroxyhept-2-ene-1,7-dioic acid aldolase [Methylobacterium nodulans ORS 2060]